MRKAYQLGRLLAALDHVGATNDVQRLYELASTEPSQMVAVLGRATTKNEQAQNVLTPILAELEPSAFDDTLGNEEQSEFALGYYHQRAEFRRGNLPQLTMDEPALTERYEFRIDADLKAWVRAHGGDKLVRSLLREAQTSNKK